MIILKYIVGPLIGAVIGYCTNYLAVKMLFHPKKEIRIHGYRLPFTPGAIPKGKPRLAKAIGESIQSFICTNGKSYIQPVLDHKIEALEEMTSSALLVQMDITQEAQKNFVKSTYQKVINEGMNAFGEKLNISSIIEEKINAMDIDDLEDMVLRVMKKELDMIVNLGALIGFILGMVNIFI